ncbi:MAG: CD225/dispanin family protein, partial [Acidimicrobiales bacterium]
PAGAPQPGAPPSPAPRAQPRPGDAGWPPPPRPWHPGQAPYPGAPAAHHPSATTTVAAPWTQTAGTGPYAWTNDARRSRGEATDQLPTGLMAPPTYLWAAVLCLFLFLPSALVALVFSLRVTRLAQVGDWRSAVRSSRLARTWCLVSVLLGAIVVVLALASGS